MNPENDDLRKKMTEASADFARNRVTLTLTERQTRIVAYALCIFNEHVSNDETDAQELAMGSLEITGDELYCGIDQVQEMIKKRLG
jgi:hypothetical protein